MKKTYSLDQLDCAACAAKMEEAASQVPGVEELRINFLTKTMSLTASEDHFEQVAQNVMAACQRVEPECRVCEVKQDTAAHHGHGHAHGHDHEEGEEHHSLALIGVGAVLFVTGLLLPAGLWRWVALIAAYVVAGGEVLLRAAKNILRGQVFDENFLMAVASLGAMLMGEATEAVAVMLFYQIGEWFQDRAVDKSRASIAQLMDIRPDHANHVLADGSVEVVPPQSLKAGDILLVKPGERIPLDGVILEGTSTLNTSALTGESVPRDVAEGDTVLSGCVNQTGVLRLRATGAYESSTVARILRLVEDSGERKASTERFITRFARWYTPAVCLAALLLALVPPLFVGEWTEWIKRALTFLVISCPCALVISVPLTFFGGVGGASRRGVLIKGANYLEQLAKTDIAVFDKTGTLTRGTFEVTAIHPNQITEEELLELAALAESYSNHPISASLRAAWNRALDKNRVTDVQEIAGRGIHALVDGRPVYAGNERLMADVHVESRPCHRQGTIVHVALDGVYMGHIVIADRVKEGSAEAIAELKALGVARTVMLTGDQIAVAQSVAKELGVDEVHAELLPGDKVEQVERLMKQKPEGAMLAFVGDGINDAPVLRRADLGIAMGGVGSDAAIEAADIVLMDDDPRKLPCAIRIARRTLRIANQNIIFALSVKAIILVMGAMGLANMWLAVFADVGVSFLAILNAMRAMRAK
ncbi:MAG TPA: cadmium-translocating P-type ATPase [Candidatus Egerieenecus merdigallinarum]|nr:cadmium-translocating P-type ATPase [Candidatus Egerieenecus merdigallinarum]